MEGAIGPEWLAAGKLADPFLEKKTQSAFSEGHTDCRNDVG